MKSFDGKLKRKNINLVRDENRPLVSPDEKIFVELFILFYHEFSCKHSRNLSCDARPPVRLIWHKMKSVVIRAFRLYTLSSCTIILINSFDLILDLEFSAILKTS